MPRVLTIGTFDGVHVGHRALIQRAREVAGPSPRGEVVALVFDPHPLSVLRPDSEPPRLSTFAQRERLLRQAGADTVLRLAPTRALLSQDAATFAKGLVRRHNPAAIVEGANFHFGREREGSTDTLRQLGRELGFTCQIVDPVEAVLSDHTIVTASSTMVRWLVSNGRVRDAAIVLGRPYTLAGTVVRGDRRGRKLGFPTANLDTPCLLPADGVYAGLARLQDGREFAAGVHVGERATFGDPRRTLEAHLLDVPAQPAGANARANGQRTRVIAGLPEYGWPIELALVAWLRDQLKFESVEALVEQMGRDCARAAQIIGAEWNARASRIDTDETPRSRTQRQTEEPEGPEGRPARRKASSLPVLFLCFLSSLWFPLRTAFQWSCRVENPGHSSMNGQQEQEAEV